jgi:hypothetical protein
MEFEEAVDNERDLMAAIAADIARACGGRVDRVKVRSIRESPVIVDLILCKGLCPDEQSTMDVFNILKKQVAREGSVLMLGQITCKAKELRLKKSFSKGDPKKSSNLKLLQGVPQVLLDLEQVITSH